MKKALSKESTALQRNQRIFPARQHAITHSYAWKRSRSYCTLFTEESIVITEHKNIERRLNMNQQPRNFCIWFALALLRYLHIAPWLRYLHSKWSRSLQRFRKKLSKISSAYSQQSQEKSTFSNDASLKRLQGSGRFRDGTISLWKICLLYTSPSPRD